MEKERTIDYTITEFQNLAEISSNNVYNRLNKISKKYGIKLKKDNHYSFPAEYAEPLAILNKYDEWMYSVPKMSAKNISDTYSRILKYIDLNIGSYFKNYFYCSEEYLNILELSLWIEPFTTQLTRIIVGTIPEDASVGKIINNYTDQIDINNFQAFVNKYSNNKGPDLPKLPNKKEHILATKGFERFLIQCINNGLRAVDNNKSIQMKDVIQKYKEAHKSCDQIEYCGNIYRFDEVFKLSTDEQRSIYLQMQLQPIDMNILNSQLNSAEIIKEEASKWLPIDKKIEVGDYNKANEILKNYSPEKARCFFNENIETVIGIIDDNIRNLKRMREQLVSIHNTNDLFTNEKKPDSSIMEKYVEYCKSIDQKYKKIKIEVDEAIGYELSRFTTSRPPKTYKKRESSKVNK
ncbi:hypothetical protein [Ruminococcus sp. HUN007]|uniref:hypothetical protein n=1 Tax=Ruminococcus sp. HUN007 TaxID=1514668 RepID=UPI0005D16663|nr:hypothetical protein [Ruminococcus sp. HUN007]